MPAWITSLLREDVTVPIPSAASRMITSRPAWARRRATARPTTPAPITTHSTLSICSSDPALVEDRSDPRLTPWRLSGSLKFTHYHAVRDDVFEESVASAPERLPGRVPVSEALIMSGQLP